MATPRNSLVPSYQWVEKFSEDDDVYERNEDGSIKEEVEYVTLDLGQIEPTLVPSSSSYRLIGLDTPTPYLQLQGTIFKGQHQDLLGTELLFTESRDERQQGQKTLNVLGTTESRIRFKEVELKPRKTGTEAGPEQAEASSSTSTKKNRLTTMEQVVGTASATEETQGRRRKRKQSTGTQGKPKAGTPGRGKGKGKAKEVPEDRENEDVQDEDRMEVVTDELGVDLSVAMDVYPSQQPTAGPDSGNQQSGQDVGVGNPPQTG